MNSIQLEYFLAVARAGSFSGAARRIHLSQPALSKQLKLLEDELGAALFIRHLHGVALTPEGRKLFSRAESVSRIISDLPAEINDLSHAVSGELNVVCGYFLSRRFMPDLLKRLLRRYPGIRARIRETSSAEQVKRLLNGDADIGFGTLPRDTSGLRYTEIFHSDLVLIRSTESILAGKKRLSKREIAEHPLVSYPPGSILYEAVHRALKPFPPNIFMDSLSSTTIIELVRQNFGVALVPDYLIDPDKRAGIVVGGFESGERVSVGYTHRADRQLPPAVRAFIEVIGEKFGINAG